MTRKIPTAHVYAPDRRPKTTWGASGGKEAIVRGRFSDFGFERLSRGDGLGPDGTLLGAEIYLLVRGDVQYLVVHRAPSPPVDLVEGLQLIVAFTGKP